uniref:AT2G27710 protein n=1 Tax=Arabidopsis thaliana TaxID=3702 RepID=C0Z3G4_ARATH|nr:AT2G27710 [Arabidopsis thaliana]
MKVVAAYLLAVLSGKASPTSADIKTILGSVGAETEDSQIELLLKEVKGKDLAELIAAGREKLASVPSGGASAAESKKEEKKEEKEESDDDMGFSLFE